MISRLLASQSSLVRAPGGDPVPAEDAPDGLRVLRLNLGDVQTELKPGATPRDPRDALSEALLGQSFAVGRGRERDAAVGVEVVDMRGLDEAVHRGVDARSGAAPSVQAVVERCDHLVLAFDARVDVGQSAQPVQPEHGKARLGQGA